MARQSVIGPQVFTRVNQLMGEGKSRTEAFKQVGEERSSPAGTVAANYYREARKSYREARKSSGGSKTRTRARRAPVKASQPVAATPRAKASANGDIAQTAAQIESLLGQLVRAVQDRDQKIRALLG